MIYVLSVRELTENNDLRLCFKSRRKYLKAIKVANSFNEKWENDLDAEYISTHTYEDELINELVKNKIKHDRFEMTIITVH